MFQVFSEVFLVCQEYNVFVISEFPISITLVVLWLSCWNFIYAHIVSIQQQTYRNAYMDFWNSFSTWLPTLLSANSRHPSITKFPSLSSQLNEATMFCLSSSSLGWKRKESTKKTRAIFVLTSFYSLMDHSPMLFVFHSLETIISYIF